MRVISGVFVVGPMTLLAWAVVLILTPSTISAPLFLDQMIDGATWGSNASSADVGVTFGYDYSADGIPEAPNSLAGDTGTSGLKLAANFDGSAGAEFVTVYPLGQSFTGDIELRFDAWMNFPIGSGVATEFMGGGIGYDNMTADIASGAQAMATGEGGSANDWRPFKSPPQFFIQDAAMTAGTHQGSDPYYADFLPAVAPPATQGQLGTSVAGSPGFQWITWEFQVQGNNVSIFIEKPNADRLEIVSYDKTDTSDGSAGVSTDGNISLFYGDLFASVSDGPALQFGIIDNVVVLDLGPVTATLTDPGVSFWTNDAAWDTPLHPNNGNGGVDYDVVINQGSATTIITAVDDIVIDNLRLENGSIGIEGTLTVLEHADWIAGTFVGAGSVNFAGTATISSSGPKSLSGVLNNSGTMTWQEGQVNFSPSGMVEAELRNTGTINMAGGGMSFVQAGGSPVLVNEAGGTLRRLPVPGTAVIGLPTTNHGTVDVQSSTLAFTDGLTNSSTGTIIGDGTIVGLVTNSGRVAPGGTGAFATLQIDDDFEQLPGGVLEIEVGDMSPPPGLVHDQLNVTGTATLAGRLDLLIVSPFTPLDPMQVDEITFLTAAQVNGEFESIFSPNLGDVMPDTAVQLIYTPGMQGGPPGDVRAHFVTPMEGDVLSPVPMMTTEWSDPTTWTMGNVPNSTNTVELVNTGPMPRRVNVAVLNAFTHTLNMNGGSPIDTITVGVIEGRSLSAVAGATVGENAIVELDAGNLVSSTVQINGGGRLAGNGTVVGNLTVGASGGTLEATLSPGDPDPTSPSAIGNLDVVGDYRQEVNGTMRVDLQDAGGGGTEYDTINVTGNARLHGTLIVDATNFTGGSGTQFEFFTAGLLEPPGEMLENTFQNIQTVGNDDIYVALTLGEPATGAGGASVGGTFSASGNICNIGDMNCSGGPLDDTDVELFARALRTPNSYHVYTWNTFLPKIQIHANDAGDVDGLNDGLDFDDVDDFADMVAAGSGATVESVLAAIERALSGVPEPSAATLLIVGGCILLAIHPLNRLPS